MNVLFTVCDIIWMVRFLLVQEQMGRFIHSFIGLIQEKDIVGLKVCENIDNRRYK